MTDDYEALRAAAEELPKGPYSECGHDRGGCKCGQVWAEGHDVCLLKTDTNSPDEGIEFFTEEQIKANARNLAVILNGLPTLLSDLDTTRTALLKAEGERDEAEIEYPERYCVYCNARLVPRIAAIVGQSAKVESLQHFRNRLFCNGWCARGMD